MYFNDFNTIVKYHDNESSSPLLIRYSRTERLSKSCWPYFNRHASNATDLFLTTNQARRKYRQTCETAGKSGGISTFQIAENTGFKGNVCQWEQFLRKGK